MTQVDDVSTRRASGARRGWAVAMAAVAALVLVLPSASSDPDRTKVPFNHKAHLPIEGVSCGDCHATTKDADSIRPGKAGHDSCNGADCHREDFYGDKHESTMMCRSCHTQSSAWADMRELWPYPEPDHKARYFYVEFNHDLHMSLEDDRPECSDCHHVDAEGRAYQAPGHVDCASCHDADHEVPMAACGGCHKSVTRPDGTRNATRPSLRQSVVRVTEKFSHETHRADRRKKEPTPLGCATCHGQAAQAERVGDIVLVSGKDTMEGVCRTCHDSRSKTADGRRIFGTRGASCKKCHSEKFMDLYYRGRLPSSH